MRWFLIALFVLCFLESRATHIVGGFFQYECLGPTANNNVNYRINFYLYRDCELGSGQAVAIEDSIPITVFNSFNTNLFTIRIGNINPITRVIDTLNDVLNDPCLVDIPTSCISREIYSGIITVGRGQSHKIAWQRCCRNAFVRNVANPGDQGLTLTADIPSYNSLNCNSSPNLPSTLSFNFCSDIAVNLDLSATDADGDSLVYSLCAPLNFPNINGNVNPQIAGSPPYTPITFIPPLTPTNPVPSSPAISINPTTGLLSGRATQNGKFVLGYCVTEYRNGLPINTITRDIQINTFDCEPALFTTVQEQTQLCEGLAVDFTNRTSVSPLNPNYVIQGYKWDFGDPNTLADTSRSLNPTYVYPDTGLYKITLISNPDLRCSDTTEEFFRVYQELDPNVQTSGQRCENNSSINFKAGGTYENYATFRWSFGPQASIANATSDSVGGVSFSGGNNFPIQLIVDQGICSDTVNRTVQLLPNPVANFSYNPSADCAPLEVNFRDLSINVASANYIWVFGDGDSAFVRNPTHTYTLDGIYDVELIVQTTSNCIDTVNKMVLNAIEVSNSFSNNDIRFDVFPKSGCAPLTIRIRDSSVYRGTAKYFYDFGNNDIDTVPEPVYTYTQAGQYDIGLLLIPQDKCIENVVETFNQPITVLPSPQADLIVSDSALTVKEALFELDSRNSLFDSSSFFTLNGQVIGSGDLISYRIKDTGTYVVSAIIANEIGCRDTASKQINVFDVFEFSIPNIFTPNGDGINDEFRMIACGVYDFEIEIFNRYGQQVFESNALELSWDGRTGGVTAKEGVYFYTITIKDFKGDFRNYQGSVTLLRR